MAQLKGMSPLDAAAFVADVVIIVTLGIVYVGGLTIQTILDQLAKVGIGGRPSSGREQYPLQ